MRKLVDEVSLDLAIRAGARIETLGWSPSV